MTASRIITLATLLAGSMLAETNLPALAQAPANAPLTAAANAMVGPGIYVSDVQRSLKFYRDILGMTVRMQYGPAAAPDVVIGFGNDPAAAGLMLLSDHTPGAPHTIQHGHGYDRLALRLADLSGTHAKLRAAGFTVTDVRVVHDVFLMAMATDPDGYKVELLGPKPR
jgi:lactoylglutathione lyase